MDHEYEPPDNDRFKTFAIGTVVAMLVLTVAVGSIVYAIAPEHGAAAAYGIGALVGFFISPLPGGVASCAVHDRRAHSEDSAPAVAESTEAARDEVATAA